MRAAATALVATGALLAPAAASALEPPTVPPPEPPMMLPGDAQAASVRQDDATWVVGARADRDVRAIADRFGAKRVTPRGSYEVPRLRARGFAAALRRAGALLYAEPNRLSQRFAVGVKDPLGKPEPWRNLIVRDTLESPPVTATSPKLVLIDSQIDGAHPEFVGSNIKSTLARAPTNLHGTATAGIAAAPQNGIGMEGVWPNMRAYNYATDNLTCASSAAQIARAVRNGAATINMSYGADQPCYAEYSEIQNAIGREVVVVASAGNEFQDGNPLEYPASLPHVLTVAAVGPDLKVSPFSNTNNAVDLAAPGVEIITSVPKAFDDDGAKDGFAFLSGTSFSAPMVAAAATWVRQMRPTLTGGQIAQAIRLSANDLKPTGWDSETGYGILSVRRALTVEEPPFDPLEPNDGIVWVDGRAFGRPDTPIFKPPAKVRTLDALSDQFEDPDDVYRVVFPPGGRLRFDVKPSFGDVDMAIFQRRATSTRQTRYLLARSQNDGTRLDRIILRNTSNAPATVYVDIYINPAVRGLDSLYRLRITRL